MMRTKRDALIAIAAGLILLATHAWAANRADRCRAAKNRAAGLYASCLQHAEAREVKSGNPVDRSACDAKFDSKWIAAETHGAGMCPTTGDQSTIGGCITAHANRVAAALSSGDACAPAVTGLPATGQTTSYGAGSDGDVQAGVTLSYTDNGDGTITDNDTGLMWEKKDDSGGIHDKDNAYTWCADISPPDGICDSGTNAMDGTIVTTFLSTLNVGFAGYTDWRIPNAKELESIVDYEAVEPTINPAFNRSATCTGCMDVMAATCSCTLSDFYWSSTSYQFSPAEAWDVLFGDGRVVGISKSLTSHVRAVRGGS